MAEAILLFDFTSGGYENHCIWNNIDNMDKRIFDINKKVSEYIRTNNLVKKGDSIVVALSGGADSVALLFMLSNICNDLSLKIMAVHVHHGIRQNSADSDLDFCISLCSNLSIPLKTFKINVPVEARKTGESIEECARRLRYSILKEAALEYNNAKIAVAHHMDDQVETVLFRMLRGTGIKGLSAMSPKNDNIIRPLLCLKKEEILDYLRVINRSYCTDETNDDKQYSRNYIRHIILPEIKSISPQYVNHIAMLSKEAREVSDYIERTALKIKEKAIAEIKADNDGKIIYESFSVNILKSEDKVIVNQVIRLAIEEMIKSLKDVTRDHIEAVYKLLDKNESKRINLPKKLTAYKNGAELIFRIENSVNKALNSKVIDFSEAIDIPCKLTLPDGRLLSITFDSNMGSDNIPVSLYTKWLDYDKIDAGLCVRFRQEGDYLLVDAKGSKKSLARYMIDEKIPSQNRNRIPVIASGNQIIWVIGYRISEYFKISNNTKNIIRLELKEQDNERKD